MSCSRVPYGNWHVETTQETLRLRFTKKGKVLLSREASSAGAADRA